MRYKKGFIMQDHNRLIQMITSMSMILEIVMLDPPGCTKKTVVEVETIITNPLRIMTRKSVEILQVISL